MKMNAQLRDVEASPEFDQSSSFKISNSAKMFNILSNQIYTDKPLAVVREIASNALDAHRMVRNTAPFNVIAPSYLEPTFVVRDFGPGLSNEDVIGLYTTFGASTKADSNDQIGAFGLGSKSPFAYTDQFTVVSYFGGRASAFNAFKDKDGTPKIVLIAEEPSLEPNGLEVRVPVKKEDFPRFVTSMERTLRYFPEGTYKAVGAVVTRPKVTMQGTNWRVTSGDEESVALMGPVAYKLDWNALFEGTVNSYSNPHPHKNVVFEFAMGDLDLQPSREALSYDATTIANVKAAIEVFKTEIAQRIIDDVEKANTRWEAIEFLKAAKERLSYLKNVVPTEITSPKHGKISDGYDVLIQGARRYPTKQHVRNPEFDFVDSVRVAETSYFMVDDVSGNEKFPKFHERVQAHCTEKLGVQAGWGSKTVVLYIVSGTSVAEVAKRLDVPESRVVLASEYEVSATAKRAKDPSQVTIYQRRKNASYGESDWMQCSSQNDKPAGSGPWFYLPMTSSKCDVANYSAIGQLVPGKVYGLTKRAQDELDMTNWQRADEWLRDQAQAQLDDPDFLLAMAKERAIRDLTVNGGMTDDQYAVMHFATKHPLRIKTPEWNLLSERVEDLYRNRLRDSVERVERAVSLGLVSVPELPSLPDIQTAAEAVVQLSPLFALLANKLGRLETSEAVLVLGSLEN